MKDGEVCQAARINVCAPLGRNERRGHTVRLVLLSYVSNWGNLAGAVLNALLTVVAHDRLDTEFAGEDEEIQAAVEILEG